MKPRIGWSSCARGEYINGQSFQSVGADSEELIKLLVAIVKTSKVAKRSE